MANVDLTKYGITGATEVIYNPSYEKLFEDEISSNLKKNEIIKFEANYLIPENKITTIRKEFIEKNNFQIYNKSKELLFSSKILIVFMNIK